MVAQWLHACLAPGSKNGPVIYNADGPVTCPSAYTRTGTVVTSRLFDYEWSMPRQQNPERTTSDAAQRARPVSSGCHPRLTRLSLRHHHRSKPCSPELPTAASVSPVCAALTSSPAVQVAARPWHPDLEQRGLGEAPLLYGCVKGESHEPQVPERA